jgi:hypothetical protein
MHYWPTCSEILLSCTALHNGQKLGQPGQISRVAPINTNQSGAALWNEKTQVLHKLLDAFLEAQDCMGRCKGDYREKNSVSQYRKMVELDQKKAVAASSIHAQESACYSQVTLTYAAIRTLQASLLQKCAVLDQEAALSLCTILHDRVVFLHSQDPLLCRLPRAYPANAIAESALPLLLGIDERCLALQTSLCNTSTYCSVEYSCHIKTMLASLVP